VQFLAVPIGDGLGGLAERSVIGDVGNWFDNMTRGYGLVAVAVVLFAGLATGAGSRAGRLFPGIVMAMASVLQAHAVAVTSTYSKPTALY